MPEVEICVDSLQSAVRAAEGGCTRLELCAALSDGGLTPTPAVVRAVKRAVSIPVFCMVRCRGGAMVYSPEEGDLMVDEATDLVAAGADGLVFGALTEQGKIDVELCRKIKLVAGSLPCTFHRAFDLLSKPVEQLEDVISLGYSRLLTSGCSATALAGTATLLALVQAAEGRCGVMAGAGVTASTAPRIVKEGGVTMLHASARLPGRSQCTGPPSICMGTADDGQYRGADTEEVRRLVAAVMEAASPIH